jgi:hypothetical protein
MRVFFGHFGIAIVYGKIAKTARFCWKIKHFLGSRLRILKAVQFPPPPPKFRRKFRLSSPPSRLRDIETIPLSNRCLFSARPPKVSAVPHSRRHERLLAAVVLKRNAKASAEDIRKIIEGEFAMAATLRDHVYRSRAAPFERQISQVRPAHTLPQLLRQGLAERADLVSDRGADPAH